MKTRFFFAALISILAFAPVAQADGTESKHASHDHEDTELGEKMDTLSHAYKKLGKQISDASKNAESLELVATIRESAEAALQLEPEKKADLPIAEQAKFVAAYRSKMKAFIAGVEKLGAALEAGDNAAAAQQLAAMKKMQRAAHKEFQKEKPSEQK